MPALCISADLHRATTGSRCRRGKRAERRLLARADAAGVRAASLRVVLAPRRASARRTPGESSHRRGRDRAIVSPLPPPPHSYSPRRRRRSREFELDHHGTHAQGPCRRWLPPRSPTGEMLILLEWSLEQCTQQ